MITVQIITLQKGAFSMGDTSKYKEENKIALGILAHVDAGKTTLRIHAAQGRYCGQYRQSR